ncbi:MAG: glycosyltransferase, partial [Aurantimicrobium sp.]
MALSSDAPETQTQVSVVIPTYNSAPWLPSTLEALELALTQTSWEAEVVIVDDGSTDNSIDILTEIQTRFSYPIKIIAQS